MKYILLGSLGILCGAFCTCSGFNGTHRPEKINQFLGWLVLGTGIILGVSSGLYLVLGAFQANDALKELDAGGVPRRRKRRDADRPKAPSKAAVAEKDDATRALLARAAPADDWFEPKYLEDVVTDLFQLFQESIEADDFTPLKPWLTPDCYVRYVGRHDHLDRPQRVAGYEDADLHRIAFVHAAITKHAEDHAVTVLLTGENDDGRLADCWTFMRTPLRWKLDRMAPLAGSDAVAKPNEAPPAVVETLRSAGNTAALKHIGGG